MRFNLKFLAVSLATFVFSSAVLAADQEYNGRIAHSARAATTGRLLVKWRDGATPGVDAKTRAERATAIAGVVLKSGSTGRGQLEVLIAEDPSTAALHQAAEQLAANPDVEYASLEYRRKAHALTNDPLLNQQWFLLSQQPAATRTDVAWDITQGNASVVVAVLDTGVRFDHPDLGRVSEGGKVLPGYDFVSNALVANDGDGRDADASDPGDWVTVADSQQAPFDQDCLADGAPLDSSWHGTRVAGLVAARTNNAAGIAGNAYNTLVLPVRVLGKCGGTDRDIIDAMRWAAGLQVGSLPLNPTPAKVINLSLGGEGVCTAAYQAAVNDVIAAGALVVASAGNEGSAVSAPANCTGVLGVAGLRHIGTKVGFSNLGPEVGIGAPGGNCVNTNGGPCLFSIVVATNTGTTTPSTHEFTNQLNYNIGTSFSSPMAASAAALLKAMNGALTPGQIVLILKDTATPYPSNSAVGTCAVPAPGSAAQDSECNCTTQTCGAGMLNTGAAAAAVGSPLAVVRTSGSFDVGNTITIDGTSSFANTGRTLVTYNWSISGLTGTAPTIANASQAATTLQFSGGAQFTLRLTITDDQGTQDTKDIAIATNTAPPPTTPPPAPTTPSISPSRGGGGGGAIGIEWFALLAMGALARRRGFRRF